MNDEQYLRFCHEALQEFSNQMAERTATLDASDPLRKLAGEFGALLENPSEIYESGPALVQRLFGRFPDFAPLFPRELLWFFGGDCLHFMPDEEIAQFQQLDDQREAAAAAGEIMNYRDARAKLLKLQ